VKATRSPNFTEIDDDGVQEDAGNRRSYADVSNLADAAGGFVVSAGMGVGRDLQDEEKGKQSQRNDDGRGQPATWPGPR